MGSPKDEKERLETALAAAYRGRGGPEPGEAWEARVMNGIRHMPEETPAIPWTDMFGRLFWRVCPVACAIVIFLAVALFRYNVTSQQDYVQILNDDTAEMVLLDPGNG